MTAATRFTRVSRRRQALRAGVGAIAVATVVAACSMSSAPTPIPTDPAAAFASGSAPAASAAPSGSTAPASASEAASPSAEAGADPALEAVIPQDVSGIHLQIVSVTGDVFAAGEGTTLLASLYPAVDLEPAASTVALGRGGTPPQLIVIAMRFPGVVRARLAQAFRDRISAASANAQFRNQQIDGHEVLTVTEPGETTPTYARLEDELLVVVLAGDNDIALAAVRGLHAEST